MKVSVNAILTTLVGGCPVTTDASDKAVEKLLNENRALNMNLPYAEITGASKEEIYKENLRIKREKLYTLVPQFKEMEDEINVAGVSLANMLKKGEMSKRYLNTCEILIGDAKELVLGPNKKLVTINFENEVQA